MIPVYKVKILFSLALTFMLVWLAGCTAPEPAQPSVVKPSIETSPGPELSDKRELTLQIVDPDLQGIAGAQVLVWLPAEAEPPPAQALQTDPQGQLLVPDLQAGQAYLLQIKAAGYRPLRRHIWGPRLALPLSTLRLSLQAGQRLHGRIVDSQGLPLAGVHLSQGSSAVLSDAEGRFELWEPEPEPEPEPLQIFKQGYQASVSSAQALASEPDIHLTAATQPLRLRWDDQLQALGLSATAFQAQAESALKQSPRQVLAWSAEALDPQRDLLWLAYPTLSWTREQQQELLAFVAAGGQVVLTTEWAGLTLPISLGLQDWLTELGLQLGQDTLAQPESRLVITRLLPDQVTRDLQQIELQRSGSLQILDPEQAHCLAYAPLAAYRIARVNPPHCVMARSLSGLGQVIVIADTSLWLSGFARADNALLWQRIQTD